MPSETNGDAGPIPVMLTVETEGNKKFKYVTTVLGTIASQLRPKASFSVFNSVLVPIGVTVLTALLTTTVGQLFQYVSWRNSTTQQEAQDQVTNATAAYNNAAVEIAKRYYRTLVFIGAI